MRKHGLIVGFCGFLTLSGLSLASPRSWYVAAGASEGAADRWANAFTNLQNALDVVGDGDTIHVAGHAFGGPPLPSTVTVFHWQNASNVTLRGGYKAALDLPLEDHPGTNNPALWPTVLYRITGSARVLTLTGLTDCLIDRVTISNGYLTAAAEVGGGLRFSNCRDVTLANSRVVNNQLNKTAHNLIHRGGGIYFHASRVAVSNSVIANNLANHHTGNIHATPEGGGAYIDSGSEVTILQSFLYGNTSIGKRLRPGYGGALHIDAGGELVVCETVIAHNTAGSDSDGSHGYGGAIANYGTTRLLNTLVVSNSSTSGHSDGIWASGVAAAMRVENTTVADNNTTGIRYGSSSTVIVSNSIVCGQIFDLVDMPLNSDGALANVWYSNIGDGQNVGQQGCVSLDPQFADRLTYHLQSTEGHYTNGYFSGGEWVSAAFNSPLLDAADPGAPCNREPAPNGGRLNMGAYGNTAVASKTPDIPIVLPALANLEASRVKRQSARLRGAVTDIGGNMPYVWFRYWADGSTTTNEIAVGYAFDSFWQIATDLTTETTYHYLVRAVNTAGTNESAVATFETHATPAVIYVSTNGTETAGTTWATAYRDLKSVWSFAGPGDTIYVAGQTIAQEATLDDVTVFQWQNATNITLRGGFEADPNLPHEDHPGTNNPAFWPTTLTRVGRDARVLTLTGLSNCVIDRVEVSNGYLTTTDEVGGGIRFSNCHDVTLANSRVVNNQINKASHYQAHHGGGIYFHASRVTVSNSVIANNLANHHTGNIHATAEGGGAYIDGGSEVIIIRSFLYGNTSLGKRLRHGYGGALHIDAGGELVVRETVMAHNTAGSDSDGYHGFGGAVANYGTTRLLNTLVVSNSSTSGHSDGIWSSGEPSKMQVENVTIADNFAVGLRSDGGIVSATNTIVRGHTTSNAYGEIVFGYSCVGGIEHGVNGNIDTNPMFEDIEGIPYRLLRGSPCAEAGINLAWITRETRDLAGELRWMGRFVDMGAYEAAYLPSATLLLIR